MAPGSNSQNGPSKPRKAPLHQHETTQTLLNELKGELQISDPETFKKALEKRFKTKRLDVMRSAQDARSELFLEIQKTHPELLNSPIDTPEAQGQVLDALERVLQEEQIEGIMQVDDLRKLPLEDLMQLEKKHAGVLLFAFTTWGDQHEKVNLQRFAPYAKPKPGMELRIDFRGNKDAYWRLGAADIIPSEVRQITVVSQETGESRTSTRRIGLQQSYKAGFFDENGYIPIFTGDTVVIGEDIDKSINKKYRKKGVRPGSWEWNLEAYRKDHENSENEFLKEVWQKDYGKVDLGPRLSPKDYERLTRKKPDQIKNFTELIRQRPNWFRAAEQASTHYREKFALSRLDPTVIYGFIRMESSFRPDAVPRGKDGKLLSSAMGLGQFIEGTWMDFYKANREFCLDRMEALGVSTSVITRSKILHLRADPVLSIYATTWYTAKHAAALVRQGRSEFKEVSAENAGVVEELYYFHHEGFGGGNQLKAYIQDAKKAHTSDSETMEFEPDSTGLKSWQKQPTPEAYYEKIRRYGQRVERYAREYQEQYKVHLENPTPEPTSELTPESQGRAPKLPEHMGSTLYIGSSSMVGLTKNLHQNPQDIVDAESGRSIIKMADRLDRIPLEQLANMQRAVILAGVKNTWAKTPETRVKNTFVALGRILKRLKEANPKMKVYVSELTPIDAEKNPRLASLTPAIDQFNEAIHSSEFKAAHPEVAIVPLSQTKFPLANDGLHVQNPEQLSRTFVEHMMRQETQEA